MAGVFGVQAKAGIGATSTVDKPLDFASESLRMSTEIINFNGYHGSRSDYAVRAAEGRKVVGGQLRLNPTPVELSYLLAYILGGTPSGTSYPLGDTLGTFFTTIDRVQKVFTYAGCGINRATFHSAPGSPFELTLDIVGQSVAAPGAAGSFPAITIDLTTKTFMHHHLTVALINSVDCFAVNGVGELTITVDNMIDASRFYNSQTLVTTQADGRQITVDVQVPYGDLSSLYSLTPDGVAVEFTWSRFACSLDFTMPAVQFTVQDPVVNGRGEIMLPLSGVARRTAGTAELVTTLDSTP